MPDRTEGSIVIGAEQSRIMAEIADFESYTKWSKEITRAEILERDDKMRGTRVAYTVEAPVVGKTDYTLAYAYRTKNAGVSWEWVEGRGAIRGLSGEYVLDPVEEGTRVVYRMTMELAIPLPGFLKRQGEKRVIDVALKGLKKRVESGG